MSETVSKVEAQRRLDEISMELNELYQRVREKEAERGKYDRIANPEDYEELANTLRIKDEYEA